MGGRGRFRDILRAYECVSLVFRIFVLKFVEGFWCGEFIGFVPHSQLCGSSFFHRQWRKIRAKGINLTRTCGEQIPFQGRCGCKLRRWKAPECIIINTFGEETMYLYMYLEIPFLALVLLKRDGLVSAAS